MAYTKFPQSGIALPMVLIFLVLMMLIGAVAIRNVTLDEKMAANSRNHQLAFQAAEKGLRHCEIGAQKNKIAAKVGDVEKALAVMFTPKSANGNAWDTWPATAPTTVTLSLSSGAAQCIIEYVSDTIALGVTQAKRDLNVKVYRITAFGADAAFATANAKVMLQSYLKF
ncbi:pilX N-terminal family protein [Collimonas arenae]|uniref:PilX N-terminal family protein n=1 Tax=Collimonas arenae TaxID=279058 RepID=A0A127PUB6_9BURK|nr:PilX N-terminal domain-containing pilus assembly protein [Collimonas arenae]AMP01410.1 pilX N-terminal family protein [Collimonas arenae]AMP11310.1 pilX N-terminal family protein [Collimonas arenae]